MMGRGISIRAVALPAEHGGWALIIEPIALGLLVAPSIAGVFIALGALACFLARHPLKLAVGDRRKNRILKRTPLADRFALLYVTLAIVFFTIAVGNWPREFLWPFIIAGPLLLIQFWYDAKGHSRKLIPEVVGALAAGSISTAIALAGGWTRTAFALWIIVACRHVPTILYLRVLLNRRRQDRRPAVDGAMIAVQFLPLIAVYVLLLFKVAPAVVIVVFAILFVRAVIGIFNQAVPTPKQLGISEIAFGAFAVLMVAAGYQFGW